MRSILERCGPVFYRHRTFLLPGTLLLLVLLFEPRAAGGSRRLDTLVDLAGFALALAGQGLRAAVIGYAYIRRGGKDGKAYADDLVTGGLFAHARNPLYLGNLLILLGLLIMFGNPVAFAIAAPLGLFFYAAIVASEEAYLRGRFGAVFDEYCRRVPRWIPDFRGLSASIADMRFNARRLTRKEYGSAYAWCAAAVLLRVYEVSVLPVYEPERAAVPVYLAGLTVLTAAWALARFLKKKRLLADRPAFSVEGGRP